LGLEPFDDTGEHQHKKQKMLTRRRNRIVSGPAEAHGWALVDRAQNRTRNEASLTRAHPGTLLTRSP